MAFAPLPDRPNIENLKKRAKTLLRAAKADDPQALAQVGPYFGDPREISLQQAQLVIARTHGFASWTRMIRHIEAGQSGPAPEQHANRFLDLVCVVYGDGPDPARFDEAAAVLADHPEIATGHLHVAAAIGDAAEVSRLIAADPAALDAKGGPFQWTPLMYAAYARLPGRSSLPAAQVLLDHGADPNAYYMWAGQYRFTALTGVFGKGEAGSTRQPPHPQVEPFARAMLQAGADPNDSQAAYNTCFEPEDLCLRLLLEYGLKPNEKSNWLVELEGRLQPNPSETMHFHLVFAIKRGFADRVRLLIDHGVDLAKPDDTYDTRTKGRTPYHTALLTGQTEIAQMLVEAGAPADPLSQAEAFEAACLSGDEVAREILQADPGTLSRVDQTQMLCGAATNGAGNAIALMLALGFDPNAGRNHTALHDAAYHGHIDVMKRLLDAGADPTIRESGHNSTPLGFAQFAGQTKAVELLRAHPMDIFTAAAIGDTERLRLMIKDDPSRVEEAFRTVRHPDANHAADWMTPLALAVLNRQAEAAVVLLEAGAKTTVIAPDGKTLVQMAGDWDAPELLQRLST